MPIDRNIVTKTVELTRAANTGYTANVELDAAYGQRGVITNVVCRLDATDDDATAWFLVITAGEPGATTVADISDTTPDEHRVYESASTASAGGSDTVADLIEATEARYSLPRGGKLKAVIKVTAADNATASTFYLTVTAEVYG